MHSAIKLNHSCIICLLGIHNIAMDSPGQRKSREQLIPRKQTASWGYKSPSATTPGKSNSMFSSIKDFFKVSS